MIKNLLPTLDHEKYLRFAIELAYNSREEGNHPFGAILVGINGEILLKAMNTFGIKGDSTSHAERNLMSLASIKYAPEFLKNCTMYASAEPCAMCSAAISEVRIGRIYFGAYDEKKGSLESIMRIYNTKNYFVPEVYGGINETECSTILKKFFQEKRQ